VATTTRLPGLTLIEHELDVPLDHTTPSGESITVFARELIADGGEQHPLLVFFQGGPGSEAPRPTGARDETTWVHRALREYRVLMLDQRGTGRSSPIGTLDGLEPQQQAQFLTHFRADSIVRDAELVREALGVERWSVLGQSFGGFCVLTYLSFFPQSLREAFFTGGLPPVGRPTDDVYSRTYPRVLDRCRQFYERYPDDRARVQDFHERIERGEIVLPTGEQLTARRFRQLGSMLGMSDGAPRLHYILERPPESPAFLHDVHEAIRFGRNPLYAVIHEACYADGVVTNWSADRLLPAEYADDPTLFTGEHVYPWMFEDEPALRPLAGAAEILAHHEWPRLYDEQQLERNEVPAAAAIYANDIYVDRELSEETAARVPGLHAWLTSEYEHNGLRADGARILDRLISLARG
jgi:pimeloyl-ACP methyl ester carboxylesterase